MRKHRPQCAPPRHKLTGRNSSCNALLRCLCWNRELNRATEQDEAGGILGGVACAVARCISAATQTSATATCCYIGWERVPPWLGGAGGSLGENPGSGIYLRRSAFVRVEVAAAECASSSQVEKKKGGRWGPRTPGGAILLKSRGRAEGRVGRNARKKFHFLLFALSYRAEIRMRGSRPSRSAGACRSKPFPPRCTAAVRQHRSGSTRHMACKKPARLPVQTPSNFLRRCSPPWQTSLLGPWRLLSPGLI